MSRAPRGRIKTGPLWGRPTPAPPPSKPTIKLEFGVTELCSFCKGKGHRPGKKEECGACGGSGVRRIQGG